METTMCILDSFTHRQVIQSRQSPMVTLSCWDTLVFGITCFDNSRRWACCQPSLGSVLSWLFKLCVCGSTLTWTWWHSLVNGSCFPQSWKLFRRSFILAATESSVKVAGHIIRVVALVSVRGRWDRKWNRYMHHFGSKCHRHPCHAMRVSVFWKLSVLFII